MSQSLVFRSAYLGYGSEIVLRSIDLTIPAGNLVAIHGPSGGGKSTLLLASLGLLAPLTGSVERVHGSSAWVPQEDRLDRLHPVSVEELVLQGIPSSQRSWGRPTGAARATARARLASLGLEGFGPQPFAQLSGGERQRALVARALCTDSQLIALDEPTSALDHESAFRVHDAVVHEAKAGRTILYVTHDPAGFSGLADMTLKVCSGEVTVDSARQHANRALHTADGRR